MKKTLLTICLPLLGFAATLGPDAGGYSAATTVFAFVDISGGGGGTSIFAGTDDGTVAISLPFTFQFYGTAYAQICISSNGAAYFLTDPTVCPTISDFANTDLTDGAPPTDLPALLPFWSDLTFQTGGAGSVFYQTLGTSPNRRFVIQWSNAFPQGSANPVTFQAILTETSGAISFQYQTVSLGAGNTASDGAQATIGIRNAGAPANAQQLQWAFDSPVVTDSLALSFTRGAGPLPPLLTAPANGGTSVAMPTTLTWATSPAATSYDVYFGTTNPPPLVTNVTTTSYSPAGMAASTAYNWQIVAKNALGTGPSGTWSFTTAAPLPPPGPPFIPPTSPLTVSPATVSLSASPTGGKVKQAVTISLETRTKGAPTFSTNATVNSGLGWLSVAPSSGTMGSELEDRFLYTYTAAVDIVVDPAGVSVGSSYTGNVNFSAGGGIASVSVTMNVAAQPANAPLVSSGGIVPLYSRSPIIQPGSWISIYGSKLAAGVKEWAGDFPTSLADTSVTINGKPAYLWFVSPGQINLQAPDDTVTGPVPVVVTTKDGTSTSSVTLAPASPSFLLFNDLKHATAIVINRDGSYDPVGPNGALGFDRTRPVAPGDTVVLYGVGFGPTTPALPAGKAVTKSAEMQEKPVIMIGGVKAEVLFAGIVLAGLYQFNVVVPAGLPSGDVSVQALVGALQTMSGPVITVR